MICGTHIPVELKTIISGLIDEGYRKKTCFDERLNRATGFSPRSLQGIFEDVTDAARSKNCSYYGLLEEICINAGLICAASSLSPGGAANS
jgi:hypothetical protein